MERYFGYAIDAAGTLEVAPTCTVAVYNKGTLTFTTIYDDEVGTPKANPFIPDATGYFHFYAPGGRYDIRFSGDGITVPFTWSDLQLIDTFNLARTDQGNSFTGNQTITGNLSVSGTGTFAGNALINSDGKIPGISSTYFASLVGNLLTNLNASELGSGTIPSARLTGTYSSPLTLSNASNVLAGSSLALGSNPSTNGALRLTYNEGIYAKNSGGVDTLLLKLGTSDTLELAAASSLGLSPLSDDTYNLGATAFRWRNGHIKDLYSSMMTFGYSLMATAGAIRLGNDSTYAVAFRTAADSDNKLFYLNASDQFVLGSTTRINGSLLPNSDDSLDIGSGSLQWRNLEMSGTATLNALKVGGGIQLQLPSSAWAEFIDVNGSSQLVLGNTSYGIKLNATKADPNSGTATLGVLPTGATAFHGWIPFIDSTGTPIWLPAFK